jgi:transcriptional regulator with XRE-family HTH domain
MATSDNSIGAVLGLLVRFYGPRRPPPSPFDKGSPAALTEINPLVRDQAPVAVPNRDRGFLGRRTAADKHGRFFMFTRMEKSHQPRRQARWQPGAHAPHDDCKSQEKLDAALGVTFQQVQKYEKGMNRIGASRLQQISHILQVPVPFFFEGAPNLHGSTDEMKKAPSPSYVSDFLATRQGLSLSKAFMRINEPNLRRRIVDLVEEICGRGRLADSR